MYIRVDRTILTLYGIFFFLIFRLEIRNGTQKRPILQKNKTEKYTPAQPSNVEFTPLSIEFQNNDF